MSAKKSKKTPRIKKKAIIILVILIATYCLSLLIPGVGGYTSYPLAYIRCFGKPVGLQTGHAPDGTPVNYTHNVPNAQFRYNDYVCSPAEAANSDDRGSTLRDMPKKSPAEIEECLRTPTDNGLHPTREACESDMYRSSSGHFIIEG